MGQLAKDAVSAQQAELAAHGCGAAATFLPAAGRSGKLQRLQVPVSESVDGELAAVDRGEQFQIGRLERVQRAHFASGPAHRFLDGLGQFS